MFFSKRSVIFLALMAGILVSGPISHAASPNFSVSFPKARNVPVAEIRRHVFSNR